ncbi:ciliary microtubule inner protein 7 isoform X2 [Mixophyes fleayi]
MEAKPPPPTAFVQRMKENPAKHIFSRHENRHIFPSSVYSFENGLGKKKILKSRESHNFTHWLPLEEEMKRQRPLLSTYRTDFWTLDEKTGKAPQLLVPRMNRATSASYCGLTTYKHMLKSHVNLQASQDPVTKQMPAIYNNNRAGTAGPSLQRSMSAPYKRLTVSDCLIWRTPDSTIQQSS